MSDSKKRWWIERVPSIHICDQCGREFSTTATRVRFCSPACNARYWNAVRSAPRREAASL
jgi:predicted  nucleic acid-binding Zn-ribbon protein